MILVLRNLALAEGHMIEVVVLEYDSSVVTKHCKETMNGQWNLYLPQVGKSCPNYSNRYVSERAYVIPSLCSVRYPQAQLDQRDPPASLASLVLHSALQAARIFATSSELHSGHSRSPALE
jgi:hypothetical protein